MLEPVVHLACASVHFGSRSPSFASLTRPKIRVLDYSALFAPLVRFKILWILSLTTELETLRVSGLRVSGFALTLPKIRVLKSDAREKRGFPSQGHWARRCLARRARPISLPRNDEERKHEMICHPEAQNPERNNSRVCSGSYPPRKSHKTPSR